MPNRKFPTHPTLAPYPAPPDVGNGHGHNATAMRHVVARIDEIDRKLDQVIDLVRERCAQNLHKSAALLTVPDACAYATVTRTRLYELIGDGVLKVKKDGRRTRITRASLDRYIKKLGNAGIPHTPIPRKAKRRRAKR